MSDISQDQLLKAARKFKKKLLLQKTASRIPDHFPPPSPPSFINLPPNFPPHLNLVAFYPEHTLSSQSQSIVRIVWISLAFFTFAMVFNFLLQVVHVIRSMYLPFVLGLVYLVCLIPWFFKFVFVLLYEDLQYGRVAHFYVSAGFSVVCICGLLVAPMQIGTPSVFEVLSHVGSGLVEIGVLFSLVGLALVVSMLLLVAAIWKTVGNSGGMFELEETNTECV
jgi:hypothetical protein